MRSLTMPEIIGYDKSIEKTVTCKNCSAVIKYVSKDEMTYKKFDYLGDFDIIHYIECPNCEDKITVRVT